VRQLGPVRGHEVLRFDGAQGDDVFVGPAVAHDADRLDRQEDGEGLAGLLVPAGGTQLVDEDGVGAAQQVGELGLHLAEDAHAQAGAGEGVAVDHVMRQAEGDAEFAHFVLEQFAQRFEQLEIELLGQAADVVVALDGVRLLGLRAGGFDHVGVDRALRQPPGVASLAASAWKTSTNSRPMILRFCSGSATPCRWPMNCAWRRRAPP
jgi:hypothetical protein